MVSLTDSIDLVKEVGEGFRPTDQKLVNHYLKLMILSSNHHDLGKIPMVDVYKYEPWDLPYQSGLSLSNYEWYFFCRLHLLEGGRIKRLTKVGYWKSTGDCHKVRHEISRKEIGLKRSLVFHVGRGRNGVATNWIMHEYSATLDLPNQGAIVLYKLIKRANKEANVQTDNSNVLSYNLVRDFEHPNVGSDLPTNYEGHHAKPGCISNDFDEGGSVSCMTFDSQNQNLHQKTDNSTGCLMIPEIEIPVLDNSFLEELDAEILQYLASPLSFNGQKFSLSPEPDSDVQLFFNNGSESETIQPFPREDDLRSLMTSELENQNQQKADQTTTYAEGEKSRQMICTSENEITNVTKTKEVGSSMEVTCTIKPQRCSSDKFEQSTRPSIMALTQLF